MSYVRTATPVHNQDPAAQPYAAYVTYGHALPQAPPDHRPSQRAHPAPPQPISLGTVAKALGIGALSAIGVGMILEACRTTRQRHDDKVERVAYEKIQQGYVVAADIRGWPRPPTTNGRRADVYAVRGRKVVVVEVEHQHTLASQHTRSQLADLERYCRAKPDRKFELRLT